MVKVTEKTPAALNPLCWERTRRWGGSISKSQAGLKQGVTSALSPGFKERIADGQRQHRGGWSCSGTSWTSVACWHCPASWLDQFYHFRLSQAHAADTPPVLAKVTPATPMWFANSTVQRANFNKPVLGGLINTLGIISNPGLHALLMKCIYMMGPNDSACHQCN